MADAAETRRQEALAAYKRVSWPFLLAGVRTKYVSGADADAVAYGGT